MIADLSVKLISFAIIYKLATILGPEYYGKYALTISLIAFLKLFTNLNTDLLGTREVSKSKKISLLYLNNIIFVKTILFVLSLFTLSFLIYQIYEDIVILKLFLILALTVLIENFYALWFFQAFNNFKLKAIIQIIQYSMYLILVMLFIDNLNDIFNVAIFYLFSSLIALSIPLNILFRRYKLTQLSFSFQKKIIKQGTVLAASQLVIYIYLNTDKLFLGYFYSDEIVGFYDIAYKFFTALSVVTFGIWSIFLPKISNIKNVEEFLVYRKMMFFSGSILALLLMVFHEEIIDLTFGVAYNDSKIILFYLGINLFVVTLNGIYASPLQLWNEESYFLKIVSISAVLNVFLNLILIPTYSMEGAIIATIASEILVLILAYSKFKRIRKCIKV